MIILCNIIFGMLPEILYIWYSMVTIKNMKKHRLLLLLLIAASYILCGILVNFTYDYQYFVYVLLSVLIFISCKLLDKHTNILDLFFGYYSIMFINYTSLIMMKLFGYTLLAQNLSKCMLIVGAGITYLYGTKLYQFCLSQWNRSSNNKIKAITLRNLIIISTNVLLFIINYYVTNFLLNMIVQGLEV